MASSAEAVLRPRLPVDLARTLRPLRHGRGDPTMFLDPIGAWWRATRTPEGPASCRITVQPALGEVRGEAWGPGASWAIEALPELLGGRDDLDGFDPRGPIRELHRRMPGLRIPRSGAVFEALVPAILAQKVTGAEATRAWASMVRAWGERAPGPAPLLLPPPPSRLLSGSWAFHRFGVERRRAETIRAAAAVAGRLERASSLRPADGRELLRSVPGVGAWTAAKVALVALGDTDAVPVGDFHLPHAVSWILAGEPRGSDARMLELLEPYRGHRGRVARLVLASGLRAPRFGPRQPARSIAHL